MVLLDNSIIEKCKSNRNLLKQYFSDDINSFGENINTFHEAYVLNRIRMFILEFNGDLTLDEFKYMLGFCPQSNNLESIYQIVGDVFANLNPEICSYLINTYNLGIEPLIENENAAQSFFSHMKSIDNFKLILNQNLPQAFITKAMVWCCNDIEKLNLLLDHGANLEELIKEIGNIRSDSLTKFFLDTLKTHKFDCVYESYWMSILLHKSIMILKNSIDLDTIRMLCDKGADIGYQGIFCDACQHIRNLEIIQYFIDNSNIRGNSIALYYAIVTDNYDVAKLLLDSGIDITDECLYEITNNSEHANKYVKLLVDYGVAPERIALCAIQDKMNLLPQFLKLGIDFNQLISANSEYIFLKNSLK